MPAALTHALRLTAAGIGAGAPGFDTTVLGGPALSPQDRQGV